MLDRFINIHTVEELERVVGLIVPCDQRERLQQVIDTFPVRFSEHLLGLIQKYSAIAQQYLPDVRELNPADGEPRCFSGLLHPHITGVERMYRDRCVIMPQPTCPAYCRFCFRKFYEHREGRALSAAQLEQTIAYVAKHQELREVLITGGEPFLDKARLGTLLDGLRQLPHIGPVRIACRALVTCPSLIDDEAIKLLQAHQDLKQGYPLEVAAHVNCPEELSPPTIEVLAKLREAGIHVFNQTVLLRGINTAPETMTRLCVELRRYGVETYNIFFNGPVQGVSYLRPTIAQALALKSELRRAVSGRANPHLIITTRLGKIELGVDGWVVEREEDNQHVWLRTPYRLSDLQAIDEDFTPPDETMADEQGFLIVRYLDGQV